MGTIISRTALKKQDGLTVVELMVILGVLGIVLALGYMYFSFSVMAFERGEQLTIAQQNTRMASGIIKRELRFAREIWINYPEDGAPGYEYIYLADDSIIFKNESGQERVLANSTVDGMPYSIYFTSKIEPDDGIPKDVVVYYIIADYDLDLAAIDDKLALDNQSIEEIMDEEAEKGLYFLKAKVIALNLELFRTTTPAGKLIEMTGHGGTVIKYKKP